MKYLIDMRVYEPAASTELPFRVPSEMVDMDGYLMVGYHTALAEIEDLDWFMDIMAGHQDKVKVIGVLRDNQQGI